MTSASDGHGLQVAQRGQAGEAERVQTVARQEGQVGVLGHDDAPVA